MYLSWESTHLACRQPWVDPQHHIKVGVVIYTCNLRTQEMGARGLEVQYSKVEENQTVLLKTLSQNRRKRRKGWMEGGRDGRRDRGREGGRESC